MTEQERVEVVNETKAECEKANAALGREIGELQELLRAKDLKAQEMVTQHATERQSIVDQANALVTKVRADALDAIRQRDERIAELTAGLSLQTQRADLFLQAASLSATADDRQAAKVFELRRQRDALDAQLASIEGRKGDA